MTGTTAYAEGNFQGSATAAPPPTQRRAAFADVAYVRRAEALREGFKKADEVILATPDPGLAAAAAERGAASLDLNAVSEAAVTSPPARRLNKSNGGVGDGRLHIGQVSPPCSLLSFFLSFFLSFGLCDD